MRTCHSSTIMKNIISASNVKGIGPVGILKLLKASAHMCDDGEFVKKHFKINQEDWNIATGKANRILDDCSRQGIKPVAYSMPEYPQLLAELADAPAILYVKGSVSALQPKAVAVIGSRKAHEQSKRIAFRLGEFFAEKGATVVSGLALGCDTEGHAGALSSSGLTVAVLAHGLDRVYPDANRGLAAKIVEAGGALVSEYPPGVKPFRTFFVQRDRIQSGLSKATVVVQTKIDGGSMHTSRFCIKQNRILAAWYPIFSGFEGIFSGNFELLNSNQAISLKNPDDLQNLWCSISGIDSKQIISDRIEQFSKVPPAEAPPASSSVPQHAQRFVQGSLLNL